MAQSVHEYVPTVINNGRISGIEDDNIFATVQNGLLPHIRVDLIKNSPANLAQLIKTAELT